MQRYSFFLYAPNIFANIFCFQLFFLLSAYIISAKGCCYPLAEMHFRRYILQTINTYHPIMICIYPLALAIFLTAQSRRLSTRTWRAPISLRYHPKVLRSMPSMAEGDFSRKQS